MGAVGAKRPPAQGWPLKSGCVKEICLDCCCVGLFESKTEKLGEKEDLNGIYKV